MQWPILQGVFSNESSDLRTTYPRNMVPVVFNGGVSAGYLRPAEGIVSFATSTSGFDRGGINWKGRHYRVMGDQFVEISETGNISYLGTVENDGKPVTMDYGFSHLGVASNRKLWLYDGTTLTQVTDIDLGPVVDFVWVDGYFLSTDGENLVVNDLNDPSYPFVYSPEKYGSSEVDADPVLAVLKLRNEVHAINRHSIEIFQNIGSQGFPFQRINGAQVRRGAVGTKACCVLTDESIAFLGGALNEPPAIWITGSGKSIKISSRDIDQILSEFSEASLASAELEERVLNNHKFLYVHLEDRTLVLDMSAEGAPIWHILTSSLTPTGKYRARHFVYVHNRWVAGDTLTHSLGTMSNTVSSHYGNKVAWEFATPLFYNESKGVIINELELVALTGRVAVGDDPLISTEYSLDGESWSQPDWISAGKKGERNKRLVWFRQGSFKRFRSQRFRGTSDAHLSVMRLEAQVEPLKYG